MVTKYSLYSWVLGKNIRWQLVLVLLVVGTVALRVVPLELQKRIINKAIGMGKEDLLIFYCLLFIGAVLFASGLKFIINLLQAYIGQQSLKRMRSELYGHILSLPLSFFRTIQPGQVVNALINELATISGFVGSAVSVPLINACTLLAMGGYLFYLNPILAALSFVLYPLQIVLVPKLQKRGNEANRYRVKISRIISGNIGEVISGIHEVHGHAAYGLENDKFKAQAQSLLEANVRMNNYRYGIKFANNLFENLGPFILFLVGGTMTIRGHSDLGSLVAFLSAYSSLSEPWRELMDFYQLLEDSRVRYKNVMDMFDVNPEHLLHPIERDIYRLHGNVDIRDLIYTTDTGGKILDNISLRIAPGEMVALVGFSGSGKSSLVQVLAQLQSYGEGHVLLDDHEVRELTKVDVAENLGMVPQHPFIFSGTVRENLLYSSQASLCNDPSGQTLPDLDQLVEVLQQMGLFVDVLKFGLQSVLSPKDHESLIAEVLALRPVFQERFGTEHREDIEFFNPEAYLEFGSIAQNIVFGDFLDHQTVFKNAYQNSQFQEFLRQIELEQELIAFGEVIASSTVPILQYGAQTPELYADSPIASEELEQYSRIVKNLRNQRRQELRQADRLAMMKLALNFTPGRHKTAIMPGKLKTRILQARGDFQQYVSEHRRGFFEFYSSEQYIQSRNIRDNILFGQPKGYRNGALEEINQHLIQLLIEEGLLESIVDRGLDFQVGSMGEYLSGGQRQKIALARVFLRKPAVYVLDEATAALDNASQSRVQKFLATIRGRHTIISVVHRLDTIVNYDRIVVMKEGKIVESGPYQDLIAAKGALYELVGTA